MPRCNSSGPMVVAAPTSPCFETAKTATSLFPSVLVRNLRIASEQAFCGDFPRRINSTTAEFSASSYEHCNNLRLRAQSRNPDIQNPALDNLLRHAYIPTPNFINGSWPVIGPIPLNENVSVQFLSWVKGPLLHDQLALTKNKPKKLISELQHKQLWVVSQMTGVWA